jgi:hypothetical protein
MNGFVLLISVVYHLSVGGPSGGSAANFAAVPFVDEQACETAASKARDMVYSQFGDQGKPMVTAACVPQSSRKK